MARICPLRNCKMQAQFLGCIYLWVPLRYAIPSCFSPRPVHRLSMPCADNTLSDIRLYQYVSDKIAYAIGECESVRGTKKYNT